ncbi:Sec-independent protein translocase subunit TatA [Protofrankia coriariae]|uniref:Sec-independent protein translocase protein TatA n=1 Tax=Protofrankia coriariae TaxID=1562887 RepID=A0ABR5F135_9ACTN|nr:Sec-independent protein translocase subunit TatA [Protofrankia coriariae]KLL10426.1 preprotein translocase subunit TatA [Protofrankia coriariae]
MPNLGTPELLIIAFVVILLFGSRKLPDAARSLGRSLRIFKAETKGLSQDEQAQAAAPSAAVPQPQPQQPQAQPAPRPIEAGQPSVASQPASSGVNGVAGDSTRG